MFSIVSFLVFTALAVASMFRVRFAFVAFVVLGALWMPARASFRFVPATCETAMSSALALHSLTNYKHIFLFTVFSMMTLAQFRGDDRWRFARLAAVVLATVIVEGEQALSGAGHCRVRDLVPNTAGTLLGAFASESIRAVGKRGGRTRSDS